MTEREIDAALAQALGWRKVRLQDGMQLWRDDKLIVDARGPNAETLADWPHLSTTWYGLGMVVDAMAAKGWECSLQRPVDGVSWVAFHRPEALIYGDVHEDKSTPMAGARAALKVLRVDVEGVGR